MRAASLRFTAIALVVFAASFALTRSIFQTSAPARGDVAASAPAESKKSASTASDSAVPLQTTQQLREALAKAMSGDDPFACASRLLALIESADAKTLQELAEHPKEWHSSELGFYRQYTYAAAKAIAERWLALDEKGALETILKSDGDILVATAELRPELVLANVAAENKDGRFDYRARVALTSLASRDLKVAREFTEQLHDPKLLKEADAAIIAGVAQRDPLRAAALAAEMKDESLYNIIVAAAEKIGPEMLRQVLQAAGDHLDAVSISPDFVLRHPELATALPEFSKTKSFPDPFGERALAEADHLSPEQRENLLANYDSLPAANRDVLAAALASSWARAEPAKAAEWAMAHGNADDASNAANNAAQQVFLRWANNDADAALAWWRALPASPLRDALGTNASTFLAENGQLDAAMELFHPRPNTTGIDHFSTVERPGSITTHIGGGTMDENATAQLAQILAERDPVSAAKWFATLPDGVADAQAARETVGAWYVRDSEAVANWIETLPAGAARDQATRVFVENAAATDPASAAEWVETISDPVLHQKSAEQVFWKMYRNDPAGARKWMSQLDSVDAEWRARLLRRWP